MNINKNFSISILLLLFFGAIFYSHATVEILQNSSIFYQFNDKDIVADGQLQVQVIVVNPKVAGFRPDALFIKVNDKILKPAQLIGRNPQEKSKGNKLYTHIKNDGGIAVPFTPSAEDFDKDNDYALASGKSMALYKFNLNGFLRVGNNIVELINKIENRAIRVDFVKFNDNELTSSAGLPLQENAVDVKPPQNNPLKSASSTSARVEISQNSSIFYQFNDKDIVADGQLQVQVIVVNPKVAGFRPDALFIKINDKILKPAQLIGRNPQEKSKGNKLYTHMKNGGGIAVPFTPSAEAFDKDNDYALASGKSMALYKFNLNGFLKAGNNVIELINKIEDRAIRVDFVKFNDNELTASVSLPPQEDAVDVKLPKVDLWKSASDIFIIADETDTQVVWRGMPLITTDEISFYPDEKLSTKVEKTVEREISGWKVINSWNSDKSLPFRKELAVTEDGKEIELNFCINQPAFQQKEGTSSLSYKIKLPLKTFIGMNYTAICGRTFKPEIVKGTITDETLNKQLASARYLVFDGNGHNIVFDFNPEGVHSYGDFGPSNIQGLWKIRKTPEYLEMSFGINNTDYGGMMNSKLRIFEGNSDDYLKRHAHHKYDYFSELPVETQFCFGAPKHGESFIQAGSALYNDDRGFGWSSKVNLDSLRISGALYTAASGNGDASFKWRLARPGLYVFTARSVAYQQARGAFSLSANDKKVFSDLEISPFTLKNISWTQWVDNGEMELVFSGKDWAISSVSAQMLQHSFEDFKFRRGYWIIEDLFEPHPLNASSCFSKPVDHVVTVSQTTLPKEPIVDPLETPIIQKREALLPDQNAPGMRWRYNAVIGTLGPSNTGSFTEFDTPELIERRLKEIKENNVNSILLNGLLSRLTFPDQHARVEKNIKDIATIGHSLNMKIIDHQDLTLLWNMGTSFRVMAEKIGMTQRTVDGNLPTRGFCLTNKLFKEFYFEWLTDFIKETNIDGIMIDETCYHGSNFCGCADCRSKFTTDTGLILPLDETSPLLQDNDSKLWKAWLQWRTESICDWYIELRCKIMAFKTDFTFMKYTTHGGFSSNYATLGFGVSISELARACDFLGTEIMSRNVMLCHRAVFAFRKAKNSLRNSFNSPIFGLVYPLQSTNFAYFGWAMNNMNAQVTWMDIGKQKDNPYTHFKENMDHRLARPLSNIGVFYSLNSFNWPRFSAVAPECLGLSQALTDRHIMHDFFMEQSINDKFLKQYRTVILPYSCCISNKNIETFLKYAREGGTLYLTGTAGLLDQLGDLHDSWPFGKALGIKHKGNEVRLSKAEKIALVGQAPLGYDKHVMNIICDPKNPPTVLASTLDAIGKEVQPLLVERKYGKGRIVYCATSLSGYNYEQENTYGRKWTYAMDEPLDKFNGQVLEKVIGADMLDFTPVNIPLQVLTSVYRQTDQGKSSTMVHLLNATGVKKLEIGKIIPGEIPEPAWPVLNEDLVFEISLPSLKQAYAVSPDYEGREPVEYQKIGEKRYRITVAKNLLKKYSIIFMVQ